ncbi:MAG: alkaline phosphatase family protein [Phycisphaerales bacterium]|nr:alkaline phosphatase family protein [Phycisphaerales bacterium]
MNSTKTGNRPRIRRESPLVWVACVVVLFAAADAHAYIGPGAGFAAVSSMGGIVIAFLAAMFALISAPVRMLIRWFKRRKAHARARVRRVVVLGLDGMEPKLFEQFLSEGKLPNFKRLMEQGCFHRLGTVAPPLSPVAWSSFLTGCNPGKHNIFDFLTRDRRNYMPMMSSVHISSHRRTLKILGKEIPYGAPEMRGLRRGKPFWTTLGEYGIFSSVIRVPITWPPEKHNGVLLSAMCLPDLRGSQGTFSFYTSKGKDAEHTGGEQIHVEFKNGVVDSYFVGPPGKDGKPVHTPFRVTMDPQTGHARIKIGKDTHELIPGKYTPWITVEFKLGFRSKVTGICEILLLGSQPHFEMYVTPFNIDPNAPAMPISHPNVYSQYLAKTQGNFATLGLAEDTWAMNEKILDDDGFLHQCIEADAEREVMFFDALKKVKDGLVVCVFDGTDRIQHMFWRYIDPQHPGRQGQCPADRQRRLAIEDLYKRNDELVGKVMAQCNDEKTLLFVISDHGFNSFRRGIDWNRWLIDHGYMTLKPDAKPGAKYLANVDWSKTRAYCLGLAGIWLNVKDREAQGIVEPGEEERKLREELCAKMSEARDPQGGEPAVKRAMDSRVIYKGPFKTEAPDIIVGYNEGYRVSWEAAVGDITDAAFRDNTKAWSGDHCIHPSLVPGVMFCNRVIEADAPRLMDIGPTALEMFGVPTPDIMDGKAMQVLEWGQRSAGAKAVDLRREAATT